MNDLGEREKVGAETIGAIGESLDHPIGPAGSTAPRLQSILRIPVLMQVIVGSAPICVENLLKLGPGAIVALDRRIGEPVDIVVNGRTIARGEVVVLEDDHTRFGVSLTEILEPQWREKEEPR